jgi:heptose I phosphotransferase
MQLANPWVSQELTPMLREESLFDDAARLQGQVFREVESRRTLRFEIGSNRYFVKLHFGVGWREIFKNLAQLRLPVLGASNEIRAILKLQNLDVATMTPVAYVSKGRKPAKMRSCIITRALENTKSLEELVLSGAVSSDLRRQLICKIARIARELHNNGMNHRDFYICHFLLDMSYFNDGPLGEPEIFLIDLHRAQIRDHTPRRWREKDIGGLLFSACDAGLTRTDIIRFVQIYTGKAFRDTLSEDRVFWNRVLNRARKLYLRDHGAPSQMLDQMAHNGLV